MLIFLFIIDCWYFCSNWLLKYLFKFFVYVSIQISCWYFCSNWLVIFFFKIDCWYFCSKRLLKILSYSIVLFVFSNSSSKTFLKMIVLIFVQKWWLIIFFKLNVDIFVQYWLLILLFKLFVDISVQIFFKVFIQLKFWCFCTNCLLLFLSEMVVNVSV